MPNPSFHYARAEEYLTDAEAQRNLADRKRSDYRLEQDLEDIETLEQQYEINLRFAQVHATLATVKA